MTLYVIATPLGNLDDLSIRAAETLRTVDLVAAEDTRRSRILLEHLGTSPPMVSFHAHSPPARRAQLLARLEAGATVALLTDAGTPSISDPGASLVREASARDVPVVPIPGPSAVTAALSVSGLPADRYLFLGFLPRKGGHRAARLAEVAGAPCTVVMFEAPLRLTRLLDDLIEVCGPDRRAVVARELTKRYEEVRSGTLTDLQVYYRDHAPRGEITLVIDSGAAPPRDPSPAKALERGRALLAAGATRRDAAATLVEEFGMSRNDAYRLIATA